MYKQYEIIYENNKMRHLDGSNQIRTLNPAQQVTPLYHQVPNGRAF